MSTTIKALFPGRREVELAVEHLVQEYGVERTDIFIEPAGSKNSAGDEPAGRTSRADKTGKRPMPLARHTKVSLSSRWI